MRIQVGKSEKDWVGLVSRWVETELSPGQRVFLPAGNTPSAVYRTWSERPTELLKSLQFVQIDDIVSGPKRGVFKEFFGHEMRPFLQQFEWINNADQRADAAILGVGVNGHVASHEPGLPADFGSGCVLLSPETRRYLDLADPTWGVTYGAAAFLKCKKILILARGENKRQVIQRAMRDQRLPIAWLMAHPNVTLISDFDLKD